jgi:hypothetical protein
MDASYTGLVEELPGYQPASGHAPTGEPILNSEDQPQIEIDPPSGPAIVNRKAQACIKTR